MAVRFNRPPPVIEDNGMALAVQLAAMQTKINSNITGWVTITGNMTLVANAGYVCDNSSLITLSLPASASFGDTINVVGKGYGGWKISQGAGQIIHFGQQSTTQGVGGYLSSQNTFDRIELLCITPNTDWVVLQVIGNINVA